jgi:uncharacterized protein (TIGR00299 family) protein
VLIAYFDPFSGASGDMILGALIDAGLSPDRLRAELSKLSLAGYSIRVERTGQHGLTGTRVSVDVDEGQPQRDWAVIDRLIADSTLDAPVKETARSIFRALAHAEAKIHGTPPDHVHFHEVGGVDAIVDICGAAIGLALLKVERVYSAPPRLGQGVTKSQHGLIPVPAPATAELLAAANAPTLGPILGQEHVPGELLTPTGAAILTTLATFTRPAFTPAAVGYGFGQKEFPWPNLCRLWIGEIAGDPADDAEFLLETNIDDMNPQAFELLTERLFAGGAYDVWLEPIQMKKGRPATKLSLICPAAKKTELESILFLNSSTLGIRSVAIQRTKAVRGAESVITRWGEIRIKTRALNGRVIDAAPEYDDCARIARETELPFREVWGEAHRLAEAFIGRKIDDFGRLS